MYVTISNQSPAFLLSVLIHFCFLMFFLDVFVADGRPIQRLDPNHPSLMAFDVVYNWEGVQEDDLRMAIMAMFVLSLLVLGFVVGYITCIYDRDAGGWDVAKNKGTGKPQQTTSVSGSRGGVYMKSNTQ